VSTKAGGGQRPLLPTLRRVGEQAVRRTDSSANRRSNTSARRSALASSSRASRPASSAWCARSACSSAASLRERVRCPSDVGCGDSSFPYERRGQIGREARQGVHRLPTCRLGVDIGPRRRSGRGFASDAGRGGGRQGPGGVPPGRGRLPLAAPRRDGRREGRGGGGAHMCTFRCGLKRIPRRNEVKMNSRHGTRHKPGTNTKRGGT